MLSTMEIKSICVFCGARTPQEKKFIELAEACGKLIGEFNLTLIYGGASTGIMGLVSRAAFDAGAYVLGVYPKFLHEREPLSSSVSESKIVDSMYERKKIMIERADAFIILPGGVGTLDEVFEVITLKSLGMLDKPIIFINTNGYWDLLNKLLASMADSNLVSSQIFDTYNFVSSAEEAFQKLDILK